MYSKKEASALRQEFWTAFGQYMAPVLSADGEKINWVNYKTGEKEIHFRVYADNKRATIAIELTHKELGVQQLYFEQFRQLKALLEDATGEEWQWSFQETDLYGKVTSSIAANMDGVSIFKKEDWPKIISFFKPRIIALDEFWSGAKYTFEALR